MLNDWNEIKEQYENYEILIGNGFSINFDERFRYTNLFQKFIDSLKTPNEQELYQSFETSNFELIMSQLLTAKSINEKFGINSEKIDNSIDILKEGLLESLSNSHPQSYEISSNLFDYLSEQFIDFATIYTLNYDLILYHIILKIKDKNKNIDKTKVFGDHFKYNNRKTLIFNGDREDVTKSIYYLHGSLFIFTKNLEIFKLTSFIEGSNFIDTIRSTIEGNIIPIIITEGSAENKLKAIKSNYYLTHCYIKLINSSNPLLIYGASLSEADIHIVDAINKTDRSIIFSIRRGSKTEDEITEYMTTIRKKFNGHKIEFVSSESVFDFDNTII